MLKNPILNALMAGAYIVLLVTIISSFEGLAPAEDNIAMPMLFLSMLVLSVATMWLLFFYSPLRMFMDGQRDEALKFFGKTLGTFAIFVAVLAVLVFVL